MEIQTVGMFIAFSIPGIGLYLTVITQMMLVGLISQQTSS